jgi:hypothetical protein
MPSGRLTRSLASVCLGQNPVARAPNGASGLFGPLGCCGNRRVQSFDQGSSTLVEFLISFLERTIKRSNARSAAPVVAEWYTAPETMPTTYMSTRTPIRFMI